MEGGFKGPDADFILGKAQQKQGTGEGIFNWTKDDVVVFDSATDKPCKTYSILSLQNQ